MFFTSLQDVIFKLFSKELSLWQIFSLRALLAIPLLLFIGRAQGAGHNVFVEALQLWSLLRAVCMTITMLSFYAAIAFLSLSTVGAANFIAPIFVTLLSAYVINEPVSVRGWIAVFIGFLGVIVLLQPGTDAFSPWAILPVIGGFFYALSHIITRTKCQVFSLSTLSLSFNLVMLMAGLLGSLLLIVLPPSGELVSNYPYIFSGWSLVSHFEWFVLGILALLTAVINMGIAGAYKVAPPSTVATFEYSYLVFAVTWDLVFFDALPSNATIVGMLMIVGAGLMVLRRK